MLNKRFFLSLVFLFLACFFPYRGRAEEPNPGEPRVTTETKTEKVEPGPHSQKTPEKNETVQQEPQPTPKSKSSDIQLAHEPPKEPFARFYVGLGYQLSYRPGKDIPYQNTDQNLAVKFGDMHYFNGLTPYLGLKFGHYLAAEAGFQATLWSVSSWSVQDGGSNPLSLQARALFLGPSLDFLGFYPISEDGSVDLVGTTGFTLQGLFIKIKSVHDNSYHDDNTNFALGARMGGGIAYHVNDNVDLRALVRYQLISHRMGKKLPGNFAGDGMVTLQISASYMF